MHAQALMQHMADLTADLAPEAAQELQQLMVQRVEEAAQAAQQSGHPFGISGAVRVLEQCRQAYTFMAPPVGVGRLGSSSSMRMFGEAPDLRLLPNSFSSSFGSRRRSFQGGSMGGGSSGSGMQGLGGSFGWSSRAGGSWTGTGTLPSLTAPSLWNSMSSQKSLRNSSVTGPGSFRGAAAAAAAAAAGGGGGPPGQGTQAAAAAGAPGAASGPMDEEQQLKQQLRSLANAAAAIGKSAGAEALAAAVAAVAAPQASGVASCEVTGDGAGPEEDDASNTAKSSRQQGKGRRK
jgi:hypothetical protein